MRTGRCRERGKPAAQRRLQPSHSIIAAPFGRWRDVRRRIIGQEDTICEDGDDTGELETLCDEVADPWTQYHQADFCEDVLLGRISLLSGRELLVSLVLLSDVAGLPLEDEGDKQG